MTDKFISAIGGTDDAEATGDGTMIGLLKRLRTLLTTGLPTDDETGALLTIDYPHHEVHEGDMAQASYKNPDGADIADNASIWMSFRTPDYAISHLVFEVAMGGDAELWMYEGGAGVSGTLLTTWNMNRYYDALIGTMSAAEVQCPVTAVTATGAFIHNSFMPGGSGPLSGGGVARAGTEWNLHTGTVYLLRIVNRSGGAVPGSLVVEWYDEALS